MNYKHFLLSFFFSFSSIFLCYSQEWKNLKSYTIETGNEILAAGNWLKKDRKKNTIVWKEANAYNIGLEKSYLKYKNIHQIHDFYIWFDEVRKEKKHEIKWVGIAAIAAGNLSKLDNPFVKAFVINNKELLNFAKQGSRDVFKFAWLKLKDVYYSDNPIKNEKAKSWDYEYGRIEQCEILKNNYNQLSEKAIKKLQKMAKGKGIYRLAIPNELRFKGDIKNCEDRFSYSINTLLDYYTKTN